ncbi:hypothetical protein CVT91_04345 [Candidatus Atribacteria bacterium HGW-Atribacteria-1]|nr:MAG: hypothetical protein CVT91_04345 [Candidatus Atribacteria bacterium HGW-Atribacteria-1]
MAEFGTLRLFRDLALTDHITRAIQLRSVRPNRLSPTSHNPIPLYEIPNPFEKGEILKNKKLWW